MKKRIIIGVLVWLFITVCFYLGGMDFTRRGEAMCAWWATSVLTAVWAAFFPFTDEL